MPTVNTPTVNVRKLDCRLQQNVEVYYQGELPFTGNVYELLGRQLDVVYQVEEGLKHGFEIEFYPLTERDADYYPNRRIRSVQHYTNNLLSGVLTRFDENGLLEETAVFEYGVCLHSTYRSEGDFPHTVEYDLSPESPEYAWLAYVQRDLALEYAEC